MPERWAIHNEAMGEMVESLIQVRGRTGHMLSLY